VDFICTGNVLGLLAIYFMLGLVFDNEDGGDVSPKRRLTFTGIHDAISQLTELFIITPVRTSIPTI
jgi:hypothetical protein